MPQKRKLNGASARYNYRTQTKKIPLIMEVKAMHKAGYKPQDIADEMGFKNVRRVHDYINTPIDYEVLQRFGSKVEREEVKQGTYLRGRRGSITQPLHVQGIPDVDNPVSFCEHKRLLGLTLFPMQRLILKCFYGMELDEEERKTVKRLEKEGKTTYQGPRKYRELVIDAGMKGGKTPLVGMISCWEEYCLYKIGDVAKHYGFQKGKETYILNVAVNADQAQSTIFAEIKGYIRNTEYYTLHRPVEDTDTTVKFANNVIVKSGHSNSASLVGKSAKVVSFDELARFKDKGGKFSSESVYTSLTRSVEPFGEDGRIISISSPLFESDMINKLYRQAGKIDNMLGFWLPTWEMNPRLPFDNPMMQTELKKNPEAFWRDFGAKPAMVQEAYYRVPDRIDEMFSRARKAPFNSRGILNPSFRGKPGMEYYLHADPSAKNDSFGLSLAHAEGRRVVVDLAYRFRPRGGEIDIDEIKEFIVSLARRFRNIRKFSYDTWQATVINQTLHKLRIPCEHMYVDKIVHDRLKELVYQDLLVVHESEILRKEMGSLQLLNGKKVDHADNSSKDVADSVAGAVWNVVENPVVDTALSYTEPATESSVISSALTSTPSRSLLHSNVFKNPFRGRFGNEQFRKSIFRR